MSKKLSLVATILGQYLARPQWVTCVFHNIICIIVMAVSSVSQWLMTKSDGRVQQTGTSQLTNGQKKTPNVAKLTNQPEIYYQPICSITWILQIISRLVLWFPVELSDSCYIYKQNTKKKLYCIVCTCITKLTKVSKLCRAMQKFLRWCWIS